MGMSQALSRSLRLFNGCFIVALASMSLRGQQPPYQSQDPVVTVIPSKTVGVPEPRFDNQQQRQVYETLVREYSLDGHDSDSGHVERLINTLLAQIGATVSGDNNQPEQATISAMFGGCKPGPALLVHVAVWHVDPAALSDGKTPRTFELTPNSKWYGYQWKPRDANLFGKCELVKSARGDGSPSFLGSRNIYFVGINAFDSQMFGSRVSVDYKFSELAQLPANFADVATALSALTGIQLTAPASSPTLPSAPTPIDNGSNGVVSTSPATILVNVSQSIIPTSPVSIRNLVPTSIAPYTINASFFLQFQPSPILVSQGQKLTKAPSSGGTPGQSDTTIYLPDHLEQLLDGSNPIGLGPLPPGLVFQSDADIALAAYMNPQTHELTQINSLSSPEARLHLVSVMAADAAENYEQYALLDSLEAVQPLQTMKSLLDLAPVDRPPEQWHIFRQAGQKIARTDKPSIQPGDQCAPSQDLRTADVDFSASPLNSYLCQVKAVAKASADKLFSEVQVAGAATAETVKAAHTSLDMAKKNELQAERNLENATSALQRDQSVLAADEVARDNAIALQAADSAADDPQIAQRTAIRTELTTRLSSQSPSIVLNFDTLCSSTASAANSASPAGAAPAKDANPGVAQTFDAAAGTVDIGAAGIVAGGPDASVPLATQTIPQLTASYCSLQGQIAARNASDEALVDAARSRLTADKSKLDSDQGVVNKDTGALNDTKRIAASYTGAAAAMDHVSIEMESLRGYVEKAQSASSDADERLLSSQQIAQCIVVELWFVSESIQPKPPPPPTSDELKACPSLAVFASKTQMQDAKELQVPKGTKPASTEFVTFAITLRNDIDTAGKTIDSRLRTIDGDVVITNQSTTAAGSDERRYAKKEKDAAPPPAPQQSCCCCQTNPAPAPVQTPAATPQANASGGERPAAATATHLDPPPARGSITGVPFRAGDFPLLLTLHSSTVPYIPNAFPGVQTGPAPPRRAGSQNGCVLPTEFGYGPDDNPCVQFISLTSTSNSSPGGGGGGKGQGAGNGGAATQGGGANSGGGPASSSSALSPSQPVDCSRQSSASGVCSFSRNFTVDEPEWWDISLGLAIPGVREKIYTATTTTSLSPVTPCPTGYTCTNKHHSDAYIFADFYPFARAWAPGRRVLFTNISYVPHIATGVPITSQSLYRPFFGLSEHLTGWFERRGLFPIGVSMYGGMTWMKQAFCSTACMVNAPTPLPYERVWRPSFGVEVSVTAIASKLSKGGGGASGAKSPSASSPTSKH
jgi:hypothetical protein